ncbi:MAG: hypothetical protein ACRD41_08515 [Candidatus Acidiferrales bacterium]
MAIRAFVNSGVAHAGQIRQWYNPARVGVPMAAPEVPCQHKRTQVIAKDADAQYVECLDCGEILEGDELPAENPFGESLSDA